MKEATYRRHDLLDRTWEILKLLPGRKGSWGGKAKDNRLFLNAVQVDFDNRRFMAWRKLMRANKIGHGASGF